MWRALKPRQCVTTTNYEYAGHRPNTTTTFHVFFSRECIKLIPTRARQFVNVNHMLFFKLTLFLNLLSCFVAFGKDSNNSNVMEANGNETRSEELLNGVHWVNWHNFNFTIFVPCKNIFVNTKDKLWWQTYCTIITLLHNWCAIFCNFASNQLIVKI